MAQCTTAGALGGDGVRSPSDSAEPGRGWPLDHRRSPPLPPATSMWGATRKKAAAVEEEVEMAIMGGPS